MIPNQHSMMVTALAMSVWGNGMLRPAKTKEQLMLERLDRSERVAIARENSPEVAAATAKRERKRLKRLALAS